MHIVNNYELMYYKRLHQMVAKLLSALSSGLNSGWGLKFKFPFTQIRKTEQRGLEKAEPEW